MARRPTPRGAARATRRARLQSAPHLSLCVLCCNEVAELDCCLASARPAVDEIVVGATDAAYADRVADVAGRHGARTIRVPWVDDFASARNVVLDAARGRWVLSLDADEELSPEGRAALPRLVAAGDAAGTLAFILTNQNDDGSLLADTRLFRRAPSVRWTSRIHEYVTVPASALATATLRQGDATAAMIHHHGYADPDLVRRKQARNLRITDLALAEEPTNGWYHYQRAVTLCGLEDYVGAVEAARAALRFTPEDDDPHLRASICAKLGEACLRLRDFAAAEAAARSALAVLPDWPDALWLLADSYRGQRRHAEVIDAFACFLTAHERAERDPTFAGRFRTLALGPHLKALAHLRLAQAYGALGEYARENDEAARAAALDADLGHRLAEAKRRARARASSTELARTLPSPAF
jgi:tetratricopeptide (TPR) repeat protein